MDEFRVLGEVDSVETIAEGNEIRDLPRGIGSVERKVKRYLE